MAEHCRNLEKAEREILEKEKADKARKERQNRDAFRELLLAHAGEGKIHAKLRWKVCLLLLGVCLCLGGRPNGCYSLNSCIWRDEPAKCETS